MRGTVVEEEGELDERERKSCGRCDTVVSLCLRLFNKLICCAARNMENQIARRRREFFRQHLVILLIYEKLLPLTCYGKNIFNGLLTASGEEVNPQNPETLLLQVGSFNSRHHFVVIDIGRLPIVVYSVMSFLKSERTADNETGSKPCLCLSKGQERCGSSPYPAWIDRLIWTRLTESRLRDHHRTPDREDRSWMFCVLERCQYVDQQTLNLK
ncbi:DNA ligase [Trichinella pseudospiralis]